jgi:hypothetical protein
VAAIYSQGKVRHFAELERQYCHFSTGGYVGARSPDHADAAIWGLTELMLDREPQSNIRFPDIFGTPDDSDNPDDDDDDDTTNNGGFRRPTSPY